MCNVAKANGQQENVRKATASVILAGDQLFLVFHSFVTCRNQNLQKLPLTNLFRIVTAITC